MSGPLDGLRVIDLTRVLAGPYCTMMLGDMGADIVKIEPPDRGDDTRAWGPPFLEGESTYFMSVNRNKRSLTLNLAVKEGQSILAALVKDADVVIDNFKLGTLDKWGFTDAWFDANAPRLIRCSITGYGASGPKAALPGYDFILQAESGLMSICGTQDGEPTKYGVAIVDICTGMLASNSILAALNVRHTSGRGQKVAVSLYETSLAMLGNIGQAFLATGHGGERRYGNGHPSIVPYTSYYASDGMIALAVGNDSQFAKCATALGHPEWGSDARFVKNRDRVANRDTVDGMIDEALKSDTADAWIVRLKAAGVPCGRINSVGQALTEPHTAARQMVETVEHPVVGALKMLGIPYKLAETPGSVRRAPPVLGQHTDVILAGELGMDAQAIAALRAGKVI
jgi:crotonobetainyl-CoA:carnitine CoA-transferase CaiB-like acyl-CoA transferase